MCIFFFEINVCFKFYIIKYIFFNVSCRWMVWKVTRQNLNWITATLTIFTRFGTFRLWLVSVSAIFFGLEALILNIRIRMLSLDSTKILQNKTTCAYQEQNIYWKSIGKILLRTIRLSKKRLPYLETWENDHLYLLWVQIKLKSF